MKCIAKDLSLRLVVGLTILWLAGAMSAYVSVRAGLYAKYDAELKLVGLQMFRSIRDGTSRFRWEQALDLNEQGSHNSKAEAAPLFELGGAYFQFWNSDGETILKSANLKELDLLLPSVQGEPGEVIWNARLEDGEPIRCVLHEFKGPMAIIILRMHRLTAGEEGGWWPTESPTIRAVVGRSLQELEGALSMLALGLGAIGALGAIATISFVRTSVADALEPVRDVGERAAAINANSLDTRFDTEELPLELEPIAERLNDLLERLEASFERERRFSTNLAHEMRTPVAELKSLAETALSYPEEADERFYNGVFEVSDQLHGSLETLQMLAQFEAEISNLKIEDINAEQLIDECWKPWDASAREKNLTVVRTGNGEVVWNGSKPLFRIILGNLISNAVEYTRPGGDIVILADKGETMFAIGNEPEDLNPSDIPKLFERFWRKETSRTNSSHSGLGLSLVSACAHRLSIEVNTKFDESSRFWIELNQER